MQNKLKKILYKSTRPCSHRGVYLFKRKKNGYLYNNIVHQFSLFSLFQRKGRYKHQHTLTQTKKRNFNFCPNQVNYMILSLPFLNFYYLMFFLLVFLLHHFLRLFLSQLVLCQTSTVSTEPFQDLFLIIGTGPKLFLKNLFKKQKVSMCSLY